MGGGTPITAVMQTGRYLRAHQDPKQVLKMPRRDYSKELYCQEGARWGFNRRDFNGRAAWKGGGGKRKKRKERGGKKKEIANDVLKCNSTFMKYSLP